jgi:predicted Ser/Thr protein kinase
VLSAGDRVGDFTIVQKIGEGGMGVVYLAEEGSLRRRVALKVIAPNFAADEDFRRRFETEGQSAAAIDHPNAVTVYSAGEADGHLYMAMRYVEGTDLGGLLRRQKRLDPVVAAETIRQVAGALDAAHALGLIHRDIKPANILIEGKGANRRAFLTDFGLSKGLEASRAGLTGTGAWVGTINYVAPEQMAGGTVDARTDIYALGCVFYEMLSGEIPFAGSDVEKMWSHANDAVPSLEEFELEHGRELDEMIARACAKDPEDRYPSAGDLGRAAVAAAEGGRVETPESSVAKGAAAAGLPAAATRSMRAGPERAAATKSSPRPTPREAPTAVVSRPSGSSTRVALVVAAAIVLAAGLIAAALVVGGSDSGSPGQTVVQRAGKTSPRPTPKPAATDSEGEPPSGERELGATASTTASEVPTMETYVDLHCACSTVRPAGEGWGEAVKSEPNPGRIFRTTFGGPAGESVLIDWTPIDEPLFGGSAESEQIVEHPAFGPMTEYAIAPGGTDLVMCQTSFCSEIIMPLSSTSGWAVVAGGFDDPAVAQETARRVALAMSPYDV